MRLGQFNTREAFPGRYSVSELERPDVETNRIPGA